MNEDTTAQDLAQLIADALKAQGIQVAPQGQGGGRYAHTAVRLPNGQVFTIQIEEA